MSFIMNFIFTAILVLAGLSFYEAFIHENTHATWASAAIITSTSGWWLSRTFCK